MNCLKCVEFYSKNKFEKLVHLVGIIIRIYHDAQSPERHIHTIFCNLIPSVLELIFFRHDLNIASLVILINRCYCPDLMNLLFFVFFFAVKEEGCEGPESRKKEGKN